MGIDLDCEQDAAAYVLGALDDVQAAAFRRHMATCPACQEEVDLLDSTATALPLLVPQSPYRPAVTPRGSTPIGQASADGRLRATDGAHPAGKAPRKPARALLARPVPKPVLVALGALLVLAFITIAMNRRPAGPQYFRGRTAWSGALAAVELDGTHGTLLVERMPRPPAGKVYEVWVEHGHNGPTPTDTVFDVNARGEAAVRIPGRLQSGDTVLVTAEPRGGTLVPTPPALVGVILA